VGLVAPVRIDPTGLNGPTRGQAGGPKWRRTSHGLYVPAWVDRTVPEQRILEEYHRLTGGAVTGWAAGRMHGANFFDGRRRDGVTEIPVPLVCDPFHQIRRGRSDDVRRDMLRSDEVVMLYGVACTVVRRATFDAMRYSANERDATEAMDMMAAAKKTSIKRMWEYVDRHPAWTGVPQVRAALELADEGSRSPQETRFRLVWQLDAGRPRPLVNRPVFDLNGNLLGYPDLLDAEAGVVGEYDGDDHRDVRQHTDDLDREARFRRHDLEICRVTGPDLRQPRRAVERILWCYGRARWTPPERRTWTLDPPPWWRPPGSS
jgi:hypothetical protein